MKRFESYIQEHMCHYKRDFLRVKEKGVYRYDGRVYNYCFILPDADKRKNIIQKYRQRFWNSSYALEDNDEQFCHLDSAQALCVNFFYPLVDGGHLEDFIQIIGLGNRKIKYNNCFRRGEHFELDLETEKGHLFFNIKYTGKAYGSLEDTEENRKAYDEKYKPMLENSEAIRDVYKNRKIFFKHYEIIRSLLRIEGGDSVVFLLPYENEMLKGYMHIIEDILKPTYLDKLKIVYWEDVFTALPDSMMSMYSEFILKYFPYLTYKVKRQILK
ncbi:MAG TPA: hypothetical protein VJ990_00505 [Clostridia bacterium]|nr:hypothetical protein [Clostridia bacterium]